MHDLTTLQAGDTGMIQSLHGDPRFISRATSIGLTVGCQIQMLKNEKKQPLLLYARDTMIAVNRNEAKKIQIGGCSHE